ncbi:MAG: glycosyltransferase [Anaerolineae bacterium]|nr:glycosyltransferase [Anaerolineae bacterium]
MAHVLFVYKQFPAPAVGHAGGEALFGLMQGLRRRGHHLTLVARILETEKAQLPSVKAVCDAVITVPHHRDLPGPRPLAIARSYLALRRAAAGALRSVHPDFVHVETTQTALVLLGMALPPASFRTQDINWFLQAQRRQHLHGAPAFVARGMELVFHCLEPLIWRKYEVLLAISEGDRHLMLPHKANKPLILLPLAPALATRGHPLPAVTDGPVLLFVGAMARDHNINAVKWFLKHIWPRIHATAPQARFCIVGGAPPDEIRAAADGSSVVVTGYVADLTPWYEAADVFVAPLLVAGGLLQKVVDAMAMGVPVVATSVCNHGLCANPGEHLLTADTPEDFAAAVLDLLHNAGARSRLGAAGRRFIDEHYNLEAALDRWEQALLGRE